MASRTDGARRPRATIVEVAQAAGVSPATVSRVLSGAKPVSADVAARVQDAVARMGYRPNPAAQGLLRGTSHSVGVVVPDLANPYFAEVLKGVTEAAEERGHRTLVTDAGEDPARESALAQELSRWADGVVLCSPRMPEARLEELVAQVPRVVVVNRVPHAGGAGSVSVDFRLGMLAVCRHLLELGHRRVVYLGGPRGAWSDAQRRSALDEAGRDGLEVEVVACGSSPSAGYEAVDAALAERPTAVLAFSDHVALGVLARLDELGVRVPQDLSVVGFDDVPLARLVRPRLTSVAVHKPGLGRLAWQLLEDPDAGDGPPLLVPPELVARESTGPPPA